MTHRGERDQAETKLHRCGCSNALRHIDIDCFLNFRQAGDLLVQRADRSVRGDRDDGLGGSAPPRACGMNRLTQAAGTSLTNQVDSAGRQNREMHDRLPEIILAYHKPSIASATDVLCGFCAPRT